MREVVRRVGSTVYVNANGDSLIPEGTKISETVDCKDGAFYVWVTQSKIAVAAIGASVIYYLIMSGFFQDKSKNLAESSLYKKELQIFSFNPTFDPNTNTTGLRISTKY